MGDLHKPGPEYASEAELLAEFKNYMINPDNVEKATNYLYNTLLDEAIVGCVFEFHYLAKTGAGEALEGIPEDTQSFAIVDSPDADVFGITNAKKAVDCNCPNCGRPVASSRFAPHLEKCMGIGRVSSRIATRRLASARENNSYFGNAASDDDDSDWNTDKKKRKTRANGRRPRNA